MRLEESAAKDDGEKEKELREHNIVFFFKLGAQKERSLQRALQLVDKEKERGEGEKGQWTARTHHNFIVFRKGKLTFTFFNRTGHINSSGTRSFALLKNSLAEACHLFDTHLGEGDIRVASSTWSGRIPLGERRQLDIVDFWQRSVRDPDSILFVSLRPWIFPGAVVRQRDKPTSIVFANGKFVIIGAKGPGDAKAVHATLLEFLQCHAGSGSNSGNGC